MRRDVVNVLTRVRRDLRFLLADRYRALLGSRFVVLTALAAGFLDRGLSLLTAARGLRTRRPAAPPAAVTVVRAAVAGLDLSLTVRDAPARADGVVLRRGVTVLTLPAVLDHGSLLRAVAALPAEACDGADWTVAITSAGASHDVVIADPAALAVRLAPPRRRAARGAAAEPRTADWPPRLRADEGRLVLRARRPGSPGVGHTLRVGVRSAVVTWPATTPAAIVLVADGDERTIPAQAADGTARAVIELGSFDTDGVWFAFVEDAAGRAPLALARDSFPLMDDTGRPHRVPLPTRGATGRAVEVGYSPDNQLVVRVGNFAVTAS